MGRGFITILGSAFVIAWHHMNTLPKRQTTTTVKKYYVLSLVDFSGIVHSQLLLHGEAINAILYSEQLERVQKKNQNRIVSSCESQWCHFLKQQSENKYL